MDYPVAIIGQLKQYLRSLRKARGMTQADLAKRLGVGQSRIADIEANPGAVSVEQLLQVLARLNAQLVLRDEQAPADAVPVASVAQGRGTPRVEDVATAPPVPGDESDSPKGQW
jgi:HTH-type transcriptional regulator / antitoxin HipB